MSAEANVEPEGRADVKAVVNAQVAVVEHEDAAALIFLRGAGIVLACACSVYSFVLCVLSWFVLNSNSVCHGQMHTFFLVVAISSTVEVAISALCCFGICSCTAALFICCAPFTGCVAVLLICFSSLLSTGLFVWGIILLAHHECIGTKYYDFGIALVVILG